MFLMDAVVGSTLAKLGQPRNQSSSDSGLSKQVSSQKYIKMAQDTTEQAGARQKYTRPVSTRQDNSFMNTINNTYGRMLADLDETKKAYVSQLKRQNMNYLIPKVEYDFSFSDRTEGERTKLLKLDT
tara:strand:- start:37 stop:417 length:381 start_codon:yes stop_codon:yes gene_type:complete